MDVSDEMQRQAKALADPSRFRLFRFIQEADGPVGVAELTELLQFNHNAIRQHLLVLVEADLVAESTEHRTTRGRPRKQYTARADALHAFRSVSGSYERLAAMLLVVASGVSPYDAGFQAATDADAAPGSAPSPVPAVRRLLVNLATEGFEPLESGPGELTLMHCPFADVAAQDQGIVCELHRGMIDGQLAADGEDLRAELIPRDPHNAGCLLSVVGEADGSTSDPSA